MLTANDLDRKAADQLGQIAGWVKRAGARIDRGLDDVHAHAERALTQTLRVTPDGRATIARVRRSASFQASLNRLTELQVDLVSLIADAREDFYRAAFQTWSDLLPDRILRTPDPEPTQADVSRVRGVALHGMPLITEVSVPVQRQKRALQARLAQAGSRAASLEDADELLTTWQQQARSAISVAVRLALSDSAVYADRIAGRDTVHPDFLDPDPTLTKGSFHDSHPR